MPAFFTKQSTLTLDNLVSVIVMNMIPIEIWEKYFLHKL